MELPDFESLKNLAETNPDELEQLRQRCCQELIDNAPERFRRRLAGLLFRIDMQSRLSSNSMQRCIKLSEMMMDSFNELRDALHFRGAGESEEVAAELAVSNDNVIPFPCGR